MSTLRASIVLALGLPGGVGLCAQEAAPARPQLTIRLQATAFNAGKTGTAVLVPSRGQTRAVLTLTGVPSGTTVPIHLEADLIEGRCERRGEARALRGPALAQSLARPGAIGASRGAVQLRYQLDEPFEQLRARPFALSVRQAPQDGGREIFCGNSPP